MQDVFDTESWAPGMVPAITISMRRGSATGTSDSSKSDTRRLRKFKDNGKEFEAAEFFVVAWAWGSVGVSVCVQQVEL